MRQIFALLCAAGLGLLVNGGVRAATQGQPELLVPAAKTPAFLSQGVNGSVAASFLKADGGGSQVYLTSKGAGGNLLSFPSPIRITESHGSPAGIVLSGDHGGFIPVQYYFIGADGALLPRPGFPAIASDLIGFSIGQAGQIGFIGRSDSTTPVNLAYTDDPGNGAPQATLLNTSNIPGSAGVPLDLGNSTLVDPNGRLMVTRLNGNIAAVFVQDGSGGWNSRASQNAALMSLLDIAPDGKFIYFTGLSTDPQPIYRSDRSVPLYTFATGGFRYGAIADNGAVAASGSDKVIYVEPDRTVVDLGALLGPDNVPTGAISMNDLGQTALVTAGADGRKLWFYDGNNLGLITDNLPLIYPQLLLTNQGEVYYYTSGPGSSDVSLYRVPVPEPAVLSLAGAMLTIAAGARPRRRRPRTGI